MSELLRVRDHSKPCKHGHYEFHEDADLMCDGGKEIVLREVEIEDIFWTCDEGDTAWVEVVESASDEDPLDQPSRLEADWMEVTER